MARTGLGRAPWPSSVGVRQDTPEGDAMGGTRVLVGTRKGAFVLTSDERRRDWEVAGPTFGGWEIYHVKGSPLDPDRVYASQSSSWFGHQS